MSLFHYVKEAVPTRQAAEYYGVKVDQHGMACCPFHHDRHPSMKVDDRYYCISCHETGDVIDFVGRLFNLAPYDAYSEVMRNYAPEWKHFDNPRSFGPRFGRQKGWERPSDAAEPEAGTNSAKPPSGNQVTGNQLSYLPIPNEQAVADGMPKEWIA